MIVCLEGNIACGKSTLLKTLRTIYSNWSNEDYYCPCPNIEFFDEPLPDCLESFYKGETNAEQLEAEFIQLKIGLFQRIVDTLRYDTIYVIDSSFISCVPYIHSKNRSNPLIQTLFSKLAEFAEKVELPINFVLLEPAVKSVFRSQWDYRHHGIMGMLHRIKQRARPGEQFITYTYLDNIAMSFDDFFDRLELTNGFLVDEQEPPTNITCYPRIPIHRILNDAPILFRRMILDHRDYINYRTGAILL